MLPTSHVGGGPAQRRGLCKEGLMFGDRSLQSCISADVSQKTLHSTWNVPVLPSLQGAQAVDEQRLHHATGVT